MKISDIVKHYLWDSNENSAFLDGYLEHQISTLLVHLVSSTTLLVLEISGQFNPINIQHHLFSAKYSGSMMWRLLKRVSLSKHFPQYFELICRWLYFSRSNKLQRICFDWVGRCSVHCLQAISAQNGHHFAAQLLVRLWQMPLTVEPDEDNSSVVNDLVICDMLKICRQKNVLRLCLLTHDKFWSWPPLCRTGTVKNTLMVLLMMLHYSCIYTILSVTLNQLCRQCCRLNVLDKVGYYG